MKFRDLELISVYPHFPKAIATNDDVAGDNVVVIHIPIIIAR